MGELTFTSNLLAYFFVLIPAAVLFSVCRRYANWKVGDAIKSSKTNTSKNKPLVLITGICFVSSLIVLSGLFSFWSDHIPALKIVGATSSPDGYQLVFITKNFSKSVCRNIQVRYAVWELADSNDFKTIGFKQVTMPGQTNLLGPDEQDATVIDLRFSGGLNKFVGTPFLAVETRCAIPFLPIFEERNSSLFFYSKGLVQWLNLNRGANTPIPDGVKYVNKLFLDGRLEELEDFSIKNLKARGLVGVTTYQSIFDR